MERNTLYWYISNADDSAILRECCSLVGCLLAWLSAPEMGCALFRACAAVRIIKKRKEKGKKRKGKDAVVGWVGG